MARRGNFDLLGKYAWCVPGGSEIFFLTLMLILGSLLGNFVTLVLVRFMGQEMAAEYSMLVSYPIMFIPAMIWAASASRRNRYEHKGLAMDNTHFAPLNWLSCILIVIASTIAAGIIGDLTNSILPPMPKWLEDAFASLTTGNLLINFICVSVFAPFFEEWLCRGMVERGMLGRGMKPFWAIVLSALFFAIIHLNPWQAIPAFLLGCLFGYVYYKTGSLKLTMLMHCTNNTCALILSNIDSLKDFDSWVDVLGEGYWYCFAAAVLLLVLAVLAFRRIKVDSPRGAFEQIPTAFGD